MLIHSFISISATRENSPKMRKNVGRGEDLGIEATFQKRDLPPQKQYGSDKRQQQGSKDSCYVQLIQWILMFECNFRVYFMSTACGRNPWGGTQSRVDRGGSKT